MLNRLILKVTKFQLPPPMRLGTVVKNILWGAIMAPMSNRVKGNKPTESNKQRRWFHLTNGDHPI